VLRSTARAWQTARVKGRGFWHGKASNCFWFYYSGLDQDWSAAVEATANVFRDAAPGDLLMNVAWRAKPPSAKDRAALAAVINDNPLTSKIAAHAFVTDSKVVYGINLAVAWITKRPWREKAFYRPDDALQWLSDNAPRFDPFELRRDIVATVPELNHWVPFFGGAPIRRSG
jgi:hypothetical protein